MHNHALKWDGRYRARLLALRYAHKKLTNTTHKND